MQKFISFLSSVPQDKLLHITYSAVLMRILCIILPIWIAASAVLFVSIVKELYDLLTRKGTPEWKDILADVIGIAIGS